MAPFPPPDIEDHPGAFPRRVLTYSYPDSETNSWRKRMVVLGVSEIEDYLAKHAAFLSFLEAEDS